MILEYLVKSPGATANYSKEVSENPEDLLYFIQIK